MKAFSAGLLAGSFQRMMKHAQISSTSPAETEVPADAVDEVRSALVMAKVIALGLELEETSGFATRLAKELEKPVPFKRFESGLHHLMDLMKSELQKRKIFAIEPDKSKYYRDDIYGVRPFQESGNALLIASNKKPPTLFSDRSMDAFPSAYMDVVEAGRCLALNRNNAAIYHLMQVAEVGLRTLAWDRRVSVKRGSRQAQVPLDYAQWGEMIGELNKAKMKINSWPRSKALRDEAFRYYSSLIFEVDSFNDIFRKHISHARNELYEPETAISCWSYVYRFMDKLSERMSEASRTKTVWAAQK